MDKIIIEGLSCFGKHGVLPEENRLGQNFIISCELYCDIEEAAHTDNIDKAVNYAEVSRFIRDFTENNVFKLIETLGYRLACMLLKKYNIKKVKLRVDKPSAPIGLPFKTVAVETCLKWNTSYIGLGSNIGDKKAYLDMAVKELSSDENIRLIKTADYIETEPYGYADQDSFLNSVAKIETIYTPFQLLDKLRHIEAMAKRERKIHWGPRTLDLDILLYEDVVMDTRDLTIPHIDMANREFVLKPLCQIAPYAMNNALGKTALQMYRELNGVSPARQNTDTCQTVKG